MARLRSIGWLGFICAALLLLATTLYLVVLAFTGSDLIELGGLPGSPVERVVDQRDGVPLTLAALAAALLTLGLWARDRRRAADASGLDSELAAARERIAAVEQARRREHEWIVDLREQLHKMQLEHGVFGGDDDIKSLVLRMTMEIVEAEKGLLISDGGEGNRDVVAAEGWENDPAQSSLAHRFADEVIERDAIVRQRRADLEGDGHGPADEEIENLIAIPIYIAGEFSGVVVCANSDDVEGHDDEVLLALGNHAGAVLSNSDLRGELRGAYVATVGMLAEAIRAKDPHLGGHSHEVSAYVGRVAERLGFDSKRREELIFASLLHDVGKIGISERILLKPGRLTEEEFTVIKLHPRIGCRLVQQVPALSTMGQYILHHHERFDGTGYPTGLRGEDIPLEARVIGVADAFSAMTSDRPYRGRMSLDEACAELERCAGGQFDPEVVRIFSEEVRKDPLSDELENPALVALDDPELVAMRAGGSPLIGDGPLELTDHLTLLYTHRYFHEVAAAEAQRAAVQASPFAVAMFVLPEIDRTNRERSYAAGDAEIKAVAHAVEQAAVHCGGSASRYSGRRLALLAPGAGTDQIESLVEKVTASVPQGIVVRATCAVWREGDSGEDVIRRTHDGPRVLSAG